MTPEPIGLQPRILVVALFTLAAAPIALLMPRNAGDDLTGRQSVAVLQPVRGPADCGAGRLPQHPHPPMYVGTQIKPRDDSDYRVWARNSA